jgi:hypothetical protein
MVDSVGNRVYSKHMETKCYTTGIEVGNRVEVTKGPTGRVGKVGVVAAMHTGPTDKYGIGGDVGITVREDDGNEFFCYTRQVRVA